MQTREHHAFSVVELLVIMAMVALLAAIAAPAYMRSKLASEIARAKQDMHAISGGLEAYKIDHINYPPMNDANTCITVPGFPGGNVTLERLTSPVSYLSGTAPFWDPFDGIGTYGGADLESVTTSGLAAAQRYPQYFYTARDANSNQSTSDINPVPTWYLLESTGPDRLHHVLGNAMNSTTSPATLANRELFSKVFYDPTNGAVSRGSIWKIGGTPEGKGSVMAELQSTTKASVRPGWEKIE